MLIDGIYNIFKDYYGEDHVDLQGNDIIVYWPEVTVTNEVNESVTIKELYAKVQLNVCRFELARCWYTQEQANSGYTHSHISRSTTLGQWGSPCLGRGPIVATMEYLRRDPSDFDRWQLFCWELDKYVRVESLNGVPYIKMREIGTDQRTWQSIEGQGADSVHAETVRELPIMLKPFIECFLKSNMPLKIAITEGVYTLGMSIKEAMLKITRNFIQWFNKNKPCTVEQLKDANIIVLVKIKNDSIYVYKKRHGAETSVTGGPTAITFKGVNKILFIEPMRQNTLQNTLWCFNVDYTLYIISVILKSLNYEQSEISGKTTKIL